MTRRDQTTAPPADWHMPPQPKRAGADDPGGIFAPKPIRGREANPGMVGGSGTGRVPIDDDAVLKISYRAKGSTEWSSQIFEAGELKMRLDHKPKPRPVNRYTPAK